MPRRRSTVALIERAYKLRLDQVEALDRAAARLGISAAEAVRRAVDLWLQQVEGLAEADGEENEKADGP